MMASSQVSHSFRPVEVAHFVIRTHNVAPLVDFYVKLFGAEIVQQTERLTFLSYDHEHHRLAIAFDPTATPRPKPGVPVCGFDHVAFTTRSLGDLLYGYRARKQAGIEPLYSVNHGISISMYYADPDGNKVELQAQAYQDAEEAKRFMAGPEFAKDPMGPRFDPESLLEQLDKGASEKQLLAQMAGRQVEGRK